MKKIFTIALLAIGLLAATPASAQSALKFGLKGGLNVTDMHFDSQVFDKSNRAGWFIGPTIKLTVPVVGLSFDASALYDYKSAKLKNNGTLADKEQTVKQQSIDVPINVRYGVGLGSVADIFLFTGPQFAFNVGDKEYKWSDTSTYKLKNSNFSWNVGLGVTVLKHLQVSGNYNIACGSTADLTYKDIIERGAEAAGENLGLKKKTHNNSWQIAVAYYF